MRQTSSERVKATAGHTACSGDRRERRHPLSFLLLTVSSVFCFSFPALAEVRVVTAQGEYRMSDRDTKEDAVRLATEAAKRNALEQVATYLESITVVEGVDVTKDEIRTYTAGLVLVVDQQTNLALDGDSIIITVDLTAQIDTEEVAQAIAALRENEDARRQLVAMKEEIDNLHHELEATNQALALATTAEQVQQASQQRQDILNRVQSHAMVSQAWTDWLLVAPVVYPYPWVGVAQAQALLNVARDLYPNSPYVQVAQQTMVTSQPPLPLQPPAEAVHNPAQQPESQPIPIPLNEISQTTQTRPPQIGNQPAGMERMVPPAESKRLTDIRQLNPLFPNRSMTPPVRPQAPVPPSRSARAMQKFLQHTPPVGQPPPTGRLPPTINRFHPRKSLGQPPPAGRLPPTINQFHPRVPSRVPSAPSQIAPRGSGGGGKFGGGREGRSGGHGGRSGGGKSGGRGR
jgi:uncharacterized membrane protein YgcG